MGSVAGTGSTTKTDQTSFKAPPRFMQAGLKQGVRGLEELTGGGAAGLGTELTDPYANLLQTGMGLAGTQGANQQLLSQITPQSLAAFNQGMGNLSNVLAGGGGVSPEAQRLMNVASNEAMNRVAGLGQGSGQTIYGSGAVDSMGRPTSGGGGTQLASAASRAAFDAQAPLALQDLYRQQGRADDARRQALNMAPMLGSLGQMADSQELQRLQGALQSGAAFNPLGSEQNRMLTGINPFLSAFGVQEGHGDRFGVGRQMGTTQTQNTVPLGAMAMSGLGSLASLGMSGGGTLGGNMLGSAFKFS